MLKLKQISDMKVAKAEPAFRRALMKLVPNPADIKAIIPINQNRYMIVKTKKKNFLLLYKRELFFNYGWEFREYGQHGVGETINIDDLKISIRNDVTTIYSVFPNGVLYKISMQEFLEKSFGRLTKEGKRTRSTSIHNFRRVGEI